MLSSIRWDGTTACLVVEGATDADVFQACIRNTLVPSLRPGDCVILITWDPTRPCLSPRNRFDILPFFRNACLQRGCTPMQRTRLLWTILLVALFLAAHAAVPLRAGALFPVATNTALLEFSGGLAFDGTNYLVGFASGTNLIGQRISTNGLFLGPTIAVGANPGFPPAVALADGGGVCLAAWSDTTLSSGVTVFGQLGSPSTGLIGSPFPLLASAGSHGVQRVRAAASDGVDFLVVWQDAANGAFYGQFVTPRGRPERRRLSCRLSRR